MTRATPEQPLARFVVGLPAGGVPPEARRILRDIVRAVAGTARAEVRLPPYAHRLVGHALRIGANPRVDAQFNAGWCVANAWFRGSPQLAHFAPDMVADAALDSLDTLADVRALVRSLVATPASA